MKWKIGVCDGLTYGCFMNNISWIRVTTQTFGSINETEIHERNMMMMMKFLKDSWRVMTENLKP